jgi:DNA polymerase-1
VNAIEREAIPLRWCDDALWLTADAVHEGQFTSTFLTFDLPFGVLDLPAAWTVLKTEDSSLWERELAARIAGVTRTLMRTIVPSPRPEAVLEKVLRWACRNANMSQTRLLDENQEAIRQKAWRAVQEADSVLERGVGTEGELLPAFRVTPTTLCQSGIPSLAVGWLADYYGWTQDAEDGQWRGSFLPLQTLGIGRGIADPARQLYRSGVIAAPTSSGKTLLAELRMLARHFGPGGRPPRTLMLVPSREIGVERAAHLRAAYGTTRRERRLRVVYSDGEHHYDDEAIRTGRFDVAVLVNEKLRAFSRTPGFFEGIGEVVFDELETMGEAERGIFLEMAFTETARYHPHLTVLGITRPADGLDCLTGTLGAESFLLETEKRPLPIDMGIWCPQTNTAVFHDCNTGVETRQTLHLGYPGNPCQTLGELLATYVRQTNEEAEQGLRNNLILAVPTKADTMRLANLLGNLYDSNDEVRTWLDASANTALLSGRLHGMEPTFRRQALSRLLPRGIGFHNADLTRDERRLVGQAFRDGEIAVLVCTRTLAKGVNLPAQSIVFLGWGVSPGGSHTEAPPFYHSLEGELVNWLGRVGRWGKQRHRPATALYLSLRPPGSEEYSRITRCLGAQRQPFRTALSDCAAFAEPIREAVASLTAALGRAPSEQETLQFLGATPSAQTADARTRLLRESRKVLAGLQLEEDSGTNEIGVVRSRDEEGRMTLLLTPLGQAASDQGISTAMCRYLQDWVRDEILPPMDRVIDPSHEESTPAWSVLDLIALVLLSPEGTRLTSLRPPRSHAEAIRAEFREATTEVAQLLGASWQCRSLLPRITETQTDRMAALLALARWRRGEPLYPTEGETTKKGFLETDYGLSESGGSLHSLAREVSRLIYVLRGIVERIPKECFPASRLAEIPPLSEGVVSIPHDLESLAEELLFGVPDEALPLARLGVAGLSRSGVMALYRQVEDSRIAPDLPLIERVKYLAEDEAAWAKALPTHGLRERVRERLAAYDRLPLFESLIADPDLIRRYYSHPRIQEAQRAQGVGRYTALRLVHRRQYTVVRRNSEPSVPLRLRTTEEVAFWAANGAVEFLSEVGRTRRDDRGGRESEREPYEVDAFRVDLLPRNGYSLEQVKQAAREVLRRLRAHDWTEGNRLLLLFDGAGGFHIAAPFPEGIFRPVEAVRRVLETIAGRLADDATIFLREQSLREPYLLLDLSVNTRRGIVRNAYSLNAVTGAVSLPVEPVHLMEFDPTEALPDRVLSSLDSVAMSETPPTTASPGPSVTSVVLTTDRQVQGMLSGLRGRDRVGLDMTLSAGTVRQAEVRLLTLAVEEGEGRRGICCYVLDCRRVNPRPVLATLSGKQIIGHDLLRACACLATRDIWPIIPPLDDLRTLARLLHAGEGQKDAAFDLLALARRYLGEDGYGNRTPGVESSPLPEGHASPVLVSRTDVERAVSRAALLLPLFDALSGKIAEAGLTPAAQIERRSLPAMAWLTAGGVPLNAALWESLARDAEEEATRLRRQLDTHAPPSPGYETGALWNWDSPLSAREALRTAGCDVTGTSTTVLAEEGHPLAKLLRRYRRAAKRLSTYGREWHSFLEDGRVYPHWHPMGTASGRMACADPNVMTVPRGSYREAVAAPPGRLLVRGDYEQIELRIGAYLAGEEWMLQAFAAGEDLHARTARSLLGQQDISPEERRLGKAANLGFLFGMQSDAFRRYALAQHGLRLSEEDARRFRQTFFSLYPALVTWQASVRRTATCEARSLSGRRRLLPAEISDTIRLNSPVQGTAADGMKRALALLYERRAQCPDAFPVLVSHDEIVVECGEETGDATAAWLLRAMVDGMAPLLRPTPVPVQIGIGKTWRSAMLRV